MDFAENVLISTTRLKRKAVFRFSFSRSNLSRHHVQINLSNQSIEQYSVMPGYAGLRLT